MSCFQRPAFPRRNQGFSPVEQEALDAFMLRQSPTERCLEIKRKTYQELHEQKGMEMPESKQLIKAPTIEEIILSRQENQLDQMRDVQMRLMREREKVVQLKKLPHPAVYQYVQEMLRKVERGYDDPNFKLEVLRALSEITITFPEAQEDLDLREAMKSLTSALNNPANQRNANQVVAPLPEPEEEKKEVEGRITHSQIFPYTADDYLANMNSISAVENALAMYRGGFVNHYTGNLNVITTLINHFKKKVREGSNPIIAINEETNRPELMVGRSGEE